MLASYQLATCLHLNIDEGTWLVNLGENVFYVNACFTVDICKQGKISHPALFTSERKKETIKQTKENRCKHCGTTLVDLPQQCCSVMALVSKHLCMGCSKISHQPSAPKGYQGRQNFHFNGSVLLGNTRGYLYSSMKDVLLS